MSADFDSPLARARVVLKDATHAGNIGAGARAIKAMGITRLVLVAPKAEIDDSARARAKSAADVLAAARVTPDLPSALTGAHFVIAFTARRRELSPLEAGARAAARARRRAVCAKGARSRSFSAASKAASATTICCWRTLSPASIPIRFARRSISRKRRKSALTNCGKRCAKAAACNG